MTTRPVVRARPRFRRWIPILILATLIILLPFAIAAAIRGDFANAALLVLMVPLAGGYAAAVLVFAVYVFKLVVTSRRESERSARTNGHTTPLRERDTSDLDDTIGNGAGSGLLGAK